MNSPNNVLKASNINVSSTFLKYTLKVNVSHLLMRTAGLRSYKNNQLGRKIFNFYPNNT